jgi:hypothetical protein
MLFSELFPSSDEDVIKENFTDQDSLDMLEEAFIIDEVSHLPEDKIKEFCAKGGVGEQMVAEGKISKKTLVRLNRQDDLTRRTKMGALMLAKQNDDPLYAKLQANRIKKKDLVSKIMAKYGHKGSKVAKQAQIEFIRGKRSKLPINFRKFGGDDRIGDEQS